MTKDRKFECAKGFVSQGSVSVSWKHLPTGNSPNSKDRTVSSPSSWMDSTGARQIYNHTADSQSSWALRFILDIAQDLLLGQDKKKKKTFSALNQSFAFEVMFVSWWIAYLWKYVFSRHERGFLIKSDSKARSMIFSFSGWCLQCNWGCYCDIKSFSVSQSI